MKTEETETQTLDAETTIVPAETEKETIADTLTDKNLDEIVEKLVKEKLSLAETATDNEEEETEEDEKPKSFGVFPALIIGGVVVFGLAAIFLQNRSNTAPDDSQTENDGYRHG